MLNKIKLLAIFATGLMIISFSSKSHAIIDLFSKGALQYYASMYQVNGCAAAIKNKGHRPILQRHNFGMAVCALTFNEVFKIHPNKFMNAGPNNSIFDSSLNNVYVTECIQGYIDYPEIYNLANCN